MSDSRAGFPDVLQKMSEALLPRFPNFTDHTILHSMDVLEYCNELIGEKQIERLSAAECDVLIMSCYLHDVGMGINQKNYELFSEQIDFGDYFETHDREDAGRIIRAFHNEYSGLMIRKYADLFDIPCEEMVFAFVQVSRGHRKTDRDGESEKRSVESIINKPCTSGCSVLTSAFGRVIIKSADRHILTNHKEKSHGNHH